MSSNSKSFFDLRKLLALLALAAAFAGISSLSVNSEQAPEVSFDGLHLDPNAKVAILYLKPDADFSVYDKFMMLDTYIAFQKNWQRHTRVAGRPIPKRDIERIKREAAELLRESFRKELEEVGGYPVVEQSDHNVLLLRPALIDLEITAPDVSVAGRMEQYVAQAGAATFYLEMYDSVSGEILARALDRRGTRNYGTARWANKVTNRADFQRLFREWAALLRAAMDEVREEHGLAVSKAG